MLKPLTRPAHLPASPARPKGGVAETMCLPAADDEDDGGFSATRMFSGEDEAPVPASGSPAARGRGESWATSRWVAKQDALAHEAAHKARTVIAAQRRADARPAEAEGTLRSGLAVLRAAFERLLPLFIGVAVTMALISALLPLFDKP